MHEWCVCGVLCFRCLCVLYVSNAVISMLGGVLVSCLKCV